MKWLLKIVLIVLISISAITISNAQTCDTAIVKANQEHNQQIWTGIGAGLQILSIGIGYVYTPTPKDTLIQKDTIALNCYNKQSQSKQLNSTITGSIYGIIAITIFSLIFK